MASFDQAQWRVQQSPLACRLTQVVPQFGEATFETVGGGRQRFVMHAKHNPLIGGPSQFVAAAPSWNPTREEVMLGSVEIAEGAQPLQLAAEPTVQVLNSLRAGLVPSFSRPLQANKNKIVSVALSPINFQSAYTQYNDCIGHLLPVTFDDIKNTVIEFSQEQSELSAAAQKKIDFLLRYISIDRSVTHFEIQGISTDTKRILDNLNLAKQRTQLVSDYLTARGVDAGRIDSKFHGERPQKNNQHHSVIIRLSRSGSAE